MKTKLHTRAQWARRINIAHGATAGECLKAIFKLAHELLAAKAALPHGDFEQMIERDLTFGPRAAQMLMRIGRDKRIAKAAKANTSSLPVVWTALRELTKLSDEAFTRGIKDGTINSEMTSRAATRYVTVTVVNRSERIAAPYYTASPREPSHKLVPSPEPPLVRYDALINKVRDLMQEACSLVGKSDQITYDTVLTDLRAIVSIVMGLSEKKANGKDQHDQPHA